MMDEVLKVRSLLGIWKSERASRVYTLSDNNLSQTLSNSPLGRYYRISVTADSGPDYGYRVNEKELLEKIESLKRQGYKIFRLKYPELQNFFRDGKPITTATLIQDFLEGADTETCSDQYTSEEVDVLSIFA